MNSIPFQVRLAQAIKSLSDAREASFNPQTGSYAKTFLDVQMEQRIAHDVAFLATTLLITAHNDALEWSEAELKKFQTHLDCEAAGFRLPQVEHEEPLPVDSNPFHYDSVSMGTSLVRGWTILHAGFDNPESPIPLGTIHLYNARTGQRIRVRLDITKELSMKS